MAQLGELSATSSATSVVSMRYSPSCMVRAGTSLMPTLGCFGPHPWPPAVYGHRWAVARAAGASTAASGSLPSWRRRAAATRFGSMSGAWPRTHRPPSTLEEVSLLQVGEVATGVEKDVFGSRLVRAQGIFELCGHGGQHQRPRQGSEDLLGGHPGPEEAAALANDREVEQEVGIGPPSAVGKPPLEGVDMHLVGRSGEDGGHCRG